jgi:hypothetical protein
VVTLKDGGGPTEESSGGDYSIHEIDSTVTVEGASLSRFHVDGSNEHPLFRPSLHGKLCCYDWPAINALPLGNSEGQLSDSLKDCSRATARLFGAS